MLAKAHSKIEDITNDNARKRYSLELILRGLKTLAAVFTELADAIPESPQQLGIVVSRLERASAKYEEYDEDED